MKTSNVAATSVFQVRAYRTDGKYEWLNIPATSAQEARNTVKAMGFIRANVASVTYTKTVTPVT